MHKGFLQAAAITGALAVLLGAFGAHGLKQVLPGASLEIFETAVRYQFYHVFALLAVAILYKEFPVKWMKRAGYLFITGIVLFSGSLYLLCYVKQQHLSFTWVGAITPFGGAAFVAGWILLLLGVTKRTA
jgi:uncharacterized membrane protein YgdD (TMEM256/DUF423 family)